MKRRWNISKYSATVSLSISVSSISFISFAREVFVTVVASFLARERSNSFILTLLRFSPSILYTSSSIIASIYCIGRSAACSIGAFKLPGHPPLMIYSIRSVRLTSPVMTGAIRLLHKSSKETLPVELPDSYNDMGRIFIRAIRPAPLCIIPL